MWETVAEVANDSDPLTSLPDSARPLAFDEPQLKEHLWRRAANLASLGHWIWDDLQDRCLYCSEELARIHEMTVAEYRAELGNLEQVYTHVHPDDRTHYRAVCEAAARAGRGYSLEARIFTKQGRLRHIREAADVVRTATGEYLYTVGIVHDVTEQKRVEEEHRRSKDALVRVLDSVNLPLFVFDRLGRITLWNAAAEKTFGWSASEAVGRLNPVLAPDQLLQLRERLRREPGAGPFEVNGRTKRGQELPLSLSLSWLEQAPVGGDLVAIAVDLTEQRATAQELERRREQMRFAVEALPVPLAVTRLVDGLVIFANAAAQRWLGLKPGISNLRDGPFYFIEEHRALFRETFLRDGRVDGLEICYRGPDGKPFWAAVTAEKVNFGGVEAISGVSLDITQLREAGERLRQAQKMEAVGQLTGGVAHDFNNLLTVILGNAETLSADNSVPAEARALADLIVNAAERGSTLTRHLLAFARRQALRPTDVDINAMIAETHDLLRRALPANVEMTLALAEALPPALVDRGQLGTALLNLVLNARDAMEQGGHITISTRAVRGWSTNLQGLEGALGQQIEIAVADDGEGMSPDVQARAFEPFFTTKEVGKGSGLGLSSVYGFAAQSGGNVSIVSEPGQGTTIRLLLNAVPRQPLAPTPSPALPAKTQGGLETVLLVEDEPTVRDFVALLLKGLGYRVVAADCGRSALPLLEATPGIDLLLTDLVMPGGISGQQLAAIAQRTKPAVRILLMSGYSGERAAGGGPPTGLPLLRKPFNRRQFAEAVRAALDQGTVRV